MMIMSKQTISRKPSAKNANDFIEQAGSNLAEGEVVSNKRAKQKKIQTPLVIPPPLLKELDDYISTIPTGISRSAWICQMIQKELENEKLKT